MVSDGAEYPFNINRADPFGWATERYHYLNKMFVVAEYGDFLSDERDTIGRFKQMIKNSYFFGREEYRYQ